MKVKESRFPLRVCNCWRQRIWYPALFRGVSDIQQVIEAASSEHEFIKVNITVRRTERDCSLRWLLPAFTVCLPANERGAESAVAWGSRIHFKESIRSDSSFQIKLFKKDSNCSKKCYVCSAKCSNVLEIF